CRSAHKYQHYRWEWEASAEERKLRYRVACSRDGSSNKMPAAVREAVRGAVETMGWMSKSEAVEYIAAMERDRRLIEECWS
ncbi:hypothetical protein AZE42_09440, partial [Rhizopogon vesiculosus]